MITDADKLDSQSMKELRLAMELSQREFGVVMGVSKEMVAQIETGRAKWKHEDTGAVAVVRSRVFLHKRYVRQFAAVNRVSFSK